jgi:HlyD family secretion protein
VKRKWKIWIFVIALVVVTGGVVAGSKYSQRGIVAVQTGRLSRQDLASVVTASGTIKPKNYVNIGSNAMQASRITEILVKEGDRVRKGQLLARLESVQPEAEVDAQKASLSSAEADSSASEASLKAADENLRSVQATIDRAAADVEQSKLDYARAELLFKEKLVARQEYDRQRTTLDSRQAALREANARLAQTKALREQTAAQLAAAQRRIALARANLVRSSDVLSRTLVTSPLDGMVTNLPVRVGETVVFGIQNSPASLIMTIADMSLITAEVKVDETDIVNVVLGQTSDNKDRCEREPAVV